MEISQLHRNSCCWRRQSGRLCRAERQQQLNLEVGGASNPTSPKIFIREGEYERKEIQDPGLEIHSQNSTTDGAARLRGRNLGGCLSHQWRRDSDGRLGGAEPQEQQQQNVEVGASNSTSPEVLMHGGEDESKEPPPPILESCRHNSSADGESARARRGDLRRHLSYRWRRQADGRLHRAEEQQEQLQTSVLHPPLKKRRTDVQATQEQGVHQESENTAADNATTAVNSENFLKKGEIGIDFKHNILIKVVSDLNDGDTIIGEELNRAQNFLTVYTESGVFRQTCIEDMQNFSKVRAIFIGNESHNFPKGSWMIEPGAVPLPFFQCPED